MSTFISTSLGVNTVIFKKQNNETDVQEYPPYFPTRDRILLLPQRQEEKTDGGVYLPDASRDKPWISRVLRWGHLVPDQLPGILEGDNVVHSKYSGTELLYKNSKYLIIAARDVLAFERFDQNVEPKSS